MPLVMQMMGWDDSVVLQKYCMDLVKGTCKWSIIIREPGTGRKGRGSMGGRYFTVRDWSLITGRGGYKTGGGGRGHVKLYP